MGGGSSSVKSFIVQYKRNVAKYRHLPMRYPVIILIDNDSGATEIFSYLQKALKISVSLKSADKFYHLLHNLYLVKTTEIGPTGTSTIEDIFDQSVREIKVDGKVFSADKSINPATQFGKTVFAEKVVVPHSNKIDFSGFAPILDRITAAMDHYVAPVAVD
jgi:hypothetical protein